MNISCFRLILLAFAVSISELSAQTLYVPGGTGGIGNIGGGNVGIGVASPSAKLEVVSIGGQSGLHLNASGPADTPALTYENSNLTGAKWVTAIGYGSQPFLGTKVVGSSQPSLVVTYAGNVGIGTTSPQAKLEVIGGSNTFGLIVEGDGSLANARIALRRANDTAATGNLDWIGNNNAVGARIGVNDSVAGAMEFKLGGSGSGSTKAIITSSGNLGIGTSSPTHKLAVNGTIRAKEVIVDTGWSDYVFKPDYKLASLSEVEGAIQRDGHLPGIPSAAEVAEHGVTVGEMQAKLLAKIEELTLHQIAQEKRTTAVENENRELRREIISIKAVRN